MRTGDTNNSSNLDTRLRADAQLHGTALLGRGGLIRSLVLLGLVGLLGLLGLLRLLGAL